MTEIENTLFLAKTDQNQVLHTRMKANAAADFASNLKVFLTLERPVADIAMLITEV